MTMARRKPGFVFSSWKLRHRTFPWWRMWVGTFLFAVSWPWAGAAQMVSLGPPLELDLGRSTASAIDARGRFTVVWEQNNSPFGLAQVFDEQGRTVAERSRVFIPSRGRSVSSSDVVVDDSGSFLLLWQHEGRPALDSRISVRFHDPLGEPESGFFEIAAAGSENTIYGVTAVRSSTGGAVVLWAQSDSETGQTIVRGQRFHFRNRPLGDALTLLRAPPEHSVQFLEAGIDDHGRVTVFWRQTRSAVPDESLYFLQRFRRNGEPRGRRKLVLRHDRRADFAMDPSGRFALVWENDDRSLDARWFDPLGRPLGDPLRVDAGVQGNRPFEVVKDRFGNTLVVWSVWEHPLEPGRIFARMFDPAGLGVGDVVDLGPGNFLSLDVNRQGTAVLARTVRENRRQDTVVVERFELTCGVGYESRCPDP